MADQKITQLTAATSPADADLVPIVQDVATTPVTKKVTWTTLKAFLKTYFDSLYSTAVKATGSELDTGTDDAKFATAKALKDSHNVPSVAPGTSGNVMTSNGTDWTSSPPAGGGAWSLVTEGTFTDDFDITSLAGNTDELYELYIEGYGDTAFGVSFRFNSDSGNNYDYTKHNEGKNSGSDYDSQVQSSSQAQISPLFYRKAVALKATIYPVSGKARMIRIDSNEYTDSNNFIRGWHTGFWTNTADQITTINVIISTAITAGKYSLFKKS